jgi:predicted 3-demethylubiquinone-9 3-methyltransferase (glyoxalase superfamily)
MAISAGPLFKFNPPMSFILNFDSLKKKRSRENLNSLRDKLSQGGVMFMPLDKYPFSERYGWLKDKYGLSCQIVPTVMDKMLQDQDPERLARVTQTFLKMKKFDLAALQRAYDGK